jgi:hypothetical protein
MAIYDEDFINIPPHIAAQSAQLSSVTHRIHNFENSTGFSFPNSCVFSVIPDGVFVNYFRRTLTLLEIYKEFPRMDSFSSQPDYPFLTLSHWERSKSFIPLTKFRRVSVDSHVVCLVQRKVDGKVNGVSVELVIKNTVVTLLRSQ